HSRGYEQDGYEDLFAAHHPFDPGEYLKAIAFDGGDNDPYNNLDSNLSVSDLADGQPFSISNPGHQYTLNFSVQLLDPVLATNTGDGVLRLNMGPYAADRRENTFDGDENFTITDTPTEGGTETVTVTAFGISQVFSGVKKIYAEGGFGDDTIN